MNSKILLLVAMLTSVVVVNGESVFANVLQAPDTSTDASFSPQSLAKLAVIVSNPSDGPRQGMGVGGRTNEKESQTGQQRFVEDIFVQTLLEMGHVVVARSDLKSLLKEQALGQSGLTDSNTVAVGKLLNVPAVLVVRITELASESERSGRRNTKSISGQVTLSAKLVSVETGTIWWQGTHTLKDSLDSPAHLQFLLSKVADELSRAFPPKQLTKPKSFDTGIVNKMALVMESNSRPSSFRQKDASNQQQEVEDKLGIQLGKKGYTLVSRSDLQTVMKEKQFQESGLTEENVTAFGKLLNVPVVMVVRINESGTSASGQRKPGIAMAGVGARLVSVETGEVLWCRTHMDAKPTTSKLDQTQVLAQVVKKIGDMFPSRAK